MSLYNRPQSSFFDVTFAEMLTQEEEKFIIYWKENREREKSLPRQLYLGLPIGLLIGIGILLNFISGWYARATMVANGESTPLVLIISIIIITIFCSIFFKRHQWDLNEQRYLELLHRKRLENSSSNVQQQNDSNSQVSN
jgi:polyferredoxin